MNSLNLSPLDKGILERDADTLHKASTALIAISRVISCNLDEQCRRKETEVLRPFELDGLMSAVRIIAEQVGDRAEHIDELLAAYKEKWDQAGI